MINSLLKLEVVFLRVWFVVAWAVFFLRNTLMASEVDFGADVRPLLSDRCYQCHGPDAATREAGLRLDLRESAIAALESGNTAIVPGQVEASEFVQRITSEDPDFVMPPPDSGKSLNTAEIATLTTWIAADAPYEQHWAFRTPERPEIPKVAVKNRNWPRNPIDNFVLTRLEQEQLEPNPEADRATLARRLALDLVGFAPSLEQIDQFLADESEGAYDRFIDRLFASPHYGEHMAADWLDVARYADTNGYQNDFARGMWPWRDWVISAYNDNMPYDQFVVEQLAGDLLPDPTLSQKVATGFNRNNRTVTENGSINEEWHVENVIDRVETTATAMLGLTMGCARCHDHKFDPISQRDFYQFFAFFNNVNERGVYIEQRGNVPPLEYLPNAEQKIELDETSSTIAKLEQRETVLDPQCAEEYDHWISSGARFDQLPNIAPDFAVPLSDEATGALSADGEVITAAMPEGSIQWKHGLWGSSGYFNGKTMLEYPGVFQPSADKEFTLEAWVKIDGVGTVFSKMDDNSDFRGIDVLIYGNANASIHMISAWDKNALKVVTEQPLPHKEWFHLALTYDGSSKAEGLSLYANGTKVSLKAEVDRLTGSIATVQPFRIGKRSTDHYFQGAIQDVGIHHRALSKESIQHRIAQKLSRSVAEGKISDLKAARRSLIELYVAAAQSDRTKELTSVRSELSAKRLKKKLLRQELPSVMVMEELAEPRKAYVLKRGVYDQPDVEQEVTADTPEFLPMSASRVDGHKDRLDLARWIVDPQNPLTARVAVNRIWQRFFGVGLLKTTEDFGVQSEPPSHPKLLDWLAAEFVSSGWDVQHLQRLIVSSATYRQSTRASSDSYRADPENRLLSRGPRFRLSSETIRDNALMISGLLNREIGGPSMKPYQPEGLWDEIAGGASPKYVQSTGDALYRRSLYIYRKRTIPHPVMSTLDSPSWEICQVRRARTNSPLQALLLLNDVTYVEAARKFGERMLLEGGSETDERITYAFRLATGRKPTGREAKSLSERYERYRDKFRANAELAAALLAHGESKRDESLDVSDLAAATVTASVILNLDETISKN